MPRHAATPDGDARAAAAPPRWRIAALAPLSLAYSAVVGLRNRRFDRVPTASVAAPVPVISVGNITVGGTGKTPIVIDIARRMRAAGRRPAVLTRGYGAKRGATPDEVMEFGEALPDTPVVIDADRARGAARAVNEFAADALLLDDGFQHRRLRRTLDLVLIDALDPWGGGWVLPAGRLREPLDGLRRAGAVLITRCNQAPAAVVDAIEARLRGALGVREVLRCGVAAAGLEFADGRGDDPAALRGQRVLCVCGLGNPATFVRLVSQLGASGAAPLRFRDHHAYGPVDVSRIAATARAAGASLVLTTRKDWVKLAPLWRDPSLPPLAKLDVRINFSDEARWDELLRAALANE